MTYQTFIPGIRHSTPKLIHKLAALGKDCGTAVHSGGLAYNVRFLTQNFRVLTPEIEGKFGNVRPTPNTWDLAGMQSICEFAQSHGMSVHWHCLIWNLFNPAWWVELDAASRQAAMREFVIGTLDWIAENYADVVVSVDVMNEEIGDHGHSHGDIIAKSGITPHLAYSWALSSQYRGKLYYNDLQTSPAWCATIYNTLIYPGLIDGLGLQGHFGTTFTYDAMFTDFVQQAAKHVEVQISECDICTFGDPAPVYRQVIRWVRDNPISRLSFWGYDCNQSWLKPQACADPLPWRQGTPNANYFAMMEEL